MKNIVLILDNIRSVHNVGSIFRTAEGAGVDTIYCIGTTPTPLDRFGCKRKDFSKVALGAEDLVAWKHLKNGITAIKRLKNKGFKVVVLEQAKDSVHYKKIRITGKTVLIVGNEVDGVSQSLLKQADVIAEIPMLGKKESLNVAVATGVMLFN